MIKTSYTDLLLLLLKYIRKCGFDCNNLYFLNQKTRSKVKPPKIYCIYAAYILRVKETMMADINMLLLQFDCIFRNENSQFYKKKNIQNYTTVAHLGFHFEEEGLSLCIISSLEIHEKRKLSVKNCIRQFVVFGTSLL